MPTIVERHVGFFQPSVSLHIHGLGTIDEDIADGQIAQQRLQWAQAKGFIKNLIDQSLPITQVEQV